MLDTLQSFLRDAGFERTYCLAYSGGLDSQVLLQLCASLRKTQPFSLRAIHVHHGLNPQADAWAAHCRRSCEELQVEFQCLRVDARPPVGESLEAYAREQRYAVLKDQLQPGEVLLTAHHQNDQAETVLLQLLRGAGPKGLSAMPSLKPFGEGRLGRPLLSQTRVELEAYAKAQGLLWVEDDLNANPHYPRNRLRHEILPQIQRHWPRATATLARSAELCAEAQAVLEEYADRDLAAVAGVRPHVAGVRPPTISVKQLLELSPARQRLILRRWFEVQGARLPNAVKLRQLQQDVLHAAEDRQPCVSWEGVELRRYQDELFLMPMQTPHEPTASYPWDFATPLAIPGVGKLTAQSLRGQGLQHKLENVAVRFRQGGETYSLPDGRHHELKKFFQEQGIPPWERDRLPLLYAEDQLVAIPGYLLVESFKTAKEEAGWVINLSK